MSYKESENRITKSQNKEKFYFSIHQLGKLLPQEICEGCYFYFTLHFRLAVYFLHRNSNNKKLTNKNRNYFR